MPQFLALRNGVAQPAPGLCRRQSYLCGLGAAPRADLQDGNAGSTPAPIPHPAPVPPAGQPACGPGAGADASVSAAAATERDVCTGRADLSPGLTPAAVRAREITNDQVVRRE